jgi:hypothetical protein
MIYFVVFAVGFNNLTMKKKIFIILLFIVTSLSAQVQVAPSHFKMLDSSYRMNATILIPYSINPNINSVPLIKYDEIAVLNSTGYCCGIVVWMEMTTVLTAWGNGGEKKLGFTSGETYNFRIWQKSSNKEYDARAKYKSGEGLTGGTYDDNAISKLDSLVGYKLSGINLVDPLPNRSELLQNYPNPFNPRTRIFFNLAKSGLAEIEIIDITGKIISKLFSKFSLPGFYNLEWDGKNSHGFPVTSGIYFYRLKADGKTLETKKMMLMK